jgi:hypothetical protein
MEFEQAVRRGANTVENRQHENHRRVGPIEALNWTTDATIDANSSGQGLPCAFGEYIRRNKTTRMMFCKKPDEEDIDVQTAGFKR